jgi:hypothetical protein
MGLGRFRAPFLISRTRVTFSYFFLVILLNRFKFHEFKEIKMSYRNFEGSVVSHHRRISLGSMIVLAALLLILTACDAQRIVVPPKDGTPPTIALTVSGAGDTFTLTETSAGIDRTLNRNSRVVLLAVARDMNGGVQNVTISGEVVVNCYQGELGRRITASLLIDNPQSGGIGSMGLTALSTAYTLDVRRWINMCSPSETFGGMGGFLTATGRNYHRGTATTGGFSFGYP